MSVKKSEKSYDEALALLAEMNEKIRGKDLVKACTQEWFVELNEKIHDLGWMPLIESMKIDKSTGNVELYCRMKIVDLDSDEARMYDFF